MWFGPMGGPPPRPPRPDSINPGARTLEEDDPRVRLIILYVLALRQACQRSVKQALEDIPKYTFDLYVPRQGIRDEFDQFLRSPASCFPGKAKRALAKPTCSATLRGGGRRWSPTLLVQGNRHMDGRFGLWEVVADERRARRVGDTSSLTQSWECWTPFSCRRRAHLSSLSMVSTRTPRSD